MFDVASTLLKQLIDIIPYFIGLSLVFEFIGSLLFGKR